MNAKSHKFRRTSCFLRNLSECLTCQTVKLNYGKVDLHQLPSLVFIYKKKKSCIFFFPLHCLIKSKFLSKIWGYYKNISALDLCGFPQCKFHLTVKYFLICRSLWAIILTHTSVIVVMLILNLWSCWYCHLYTASFFFVAKPRFDSQVMQEIYLFRYDVLWKMLKRAFLSPQAQPWPLWDCTTLL